MHFGSKNFRIIENEEAFDFTSSSGTNLKWQNVFPTWNLSLSSTKHVKPELLRGAKPWHHIWSRDFKNFSRLKSRSQY
ncbi:hypothetical protein RRG08_040541 [Elysia crispata]|uniref:Uncharacterized protein n=1 Tax=Elysia crispata TaxID=231223 RepID=A0AAE0Z3E1_9GAST|nr:hypothetical protein RRG08_040541 [Elysia crispata]